MKAEMMQCPVCGAANKPGDIRHCRKCGLKWCVDCCPVQGGMASPAGSKCPFCWAEHFDAIPKQSLDYDNPDETVNFRDVGEWINLIAQRTVIPEHHLFRGGTIKAVRDPKVIGNPKTVFCLQKGPDPDLPGVINIHFSISNDYEKYNTSLPEVRAWLRDIVRSIERGIDFPLYIHCLSGRDRTGVVVAALLKICGAEPEHIIEEYHLSIGTEKRNHIELTLNGLADIEAYFSGIDLGQIRALLQAKDRDGPF